jgi:thioredoxin-related protein
MNRSISSFFLILLVISQFALAEEISDTKVTWLTDFEQAIKQCKQTNKLILMAFTGSDWCHACMRLTKEQFENKSFKKFVAENFILIQVDFPRSKRNRLSSSQIAKNEKLAERYNPDGIVPFLVIVDESEAAIGKTGYQEWTPAEFINKLKSLMRKDKD